MPLVARQEPAWLVKGRTNLGLLSPQFPRPPPPRREKAFIWFSQQEQEETLQRLVELQAEGERRHQRDKERQNLRVSPTWFKRPSALCEVAAGSPCSEPWILVQLHH